MSIVLSSLHFSYATNFKPTRNRVRVKRNIEVNAEQLGELACKVLAAVFKHLHSDQKITEEQCNIEQGTDTIAIASACCSTGDCLLVGGNVKKRHFSGKKVTFTSNFGLQSTFYNIIHNTIRGKKNLTFKFFSA